MRVVNGEGVDELAEEVRLAEEDVFPDRTNLVLGCPAKFVKSDLFPIGTMLHDFLKFKLTVYGDIYLETQKIRAM